MTIQNCERHDSTFEIGEKCRQCETVQKTQQDKRVKELESEVAEWQGQALGNGLAYANLFKEFVELQANNHDLREALEENHYCNSSDKAIALYNKAISATPAESLQAHDDDVIEKCAKVIENGNFLTDTSAEAIISKSAAKAIRALKSKP